MTTLASATLELAKILMYYQSGTATGPVHASASATTLVDTARTEPDDNWNGGTIWFTGGSPALSSGKSRTITDFVLSTFTLTYQTTTTLNEAGDTYTVATREYPKGILVDCINRAQRSIGNVTRENTALVSVANQEEYVLPSGVRNVTRVEIASGNAETTLYSAATIAFAASTRSITDTANGLAVAETNDLIHITGSTYNDGIYTVETGGVAGTIVVKENLTTEALGDTVTIYEVTQPWNWVPSFSYREIPNSGIIRFFPGRSVGVTGYVIKLFYDTSLTDVSSDTDTITDYIHLDRLVYEAAVLAYEWKLSAVKDQASPMLMAKLNDARIYREEMRRRHPIIKTPKSPKLSL